ncbi:GGDEF domain-containing protein [Maridesulfovibrio sp.]|uniref:GGDEF domain-containing protein n=1 Tax=Maridesulfovibrio sp. TaxID=2795000 RepID=UPI0029CA3EEB|nr:GGDEF domain-containing protein [Maridesulfovibrio sp.]
MKFQNYARLRYKISLPIILILSLTSLYIFHTLIIERKNCTNTLELINGLQNTAVEMLTAPKGRGTDSSARVFDDIMNKLQSYPADNRFSKLLNSEKSGLFSTASDFLKTVKTESPEAINKNMRRLAAAVEMVSSDINKIFYSRHVNLIKYEYAIIFLICILVVLQYTLVDAPMRDELLRCAREKELNKSTIKKLAERDTLTNLPGRMKFYEESEKAVATATRYGSDLALIKMDIHDFKTINRKLGQKVGDKILAGFARLVRKNLRRPDSFFRVGGDKFIILAPHTSVKNAKSLTEKINKLISLSKSLKNTSLLLNTGIAMCEVDETAETLLKKVDLALKESKKYGPGTIYTHPESAKKAE